MIHTVPPLPKAFVWKRLHSLAGLWLVLFLIVHLLANSQAALFIGDSGSGFVKAVNDIHSLPYLPVIEIVLLAIPFIIHIFWGIQYLQSGEINSHKTDGRAPALPEYPRNHAYTWQRITSWILLFLITAHVVQMRFLESPASAAKGTETFYMTRVNADMGIYPLSERLGVTLYDTNQVAAEQEKMSKLHFDSSHVTPQELVEAQKFNQEQKWIRALTERPLQAGQVIAVSNNFGTAELLMVRESFKRPEMLLLYTVLVLSACFHAFNGLWTFCITWGVTLSVRSQKLMRIVSTGLMFLITFLGLAAIWGTYWLNLKQ